MVPAATVWILYPIFSNKDIISNPSQVNIKLRLHLFRGNSSEVSGDVGCVLSIDLDFRKSINFLTFAGKITVLSSDQTDPELVIGGIPNAHEVYNAIRDAWSKATAKVTEELNLITI